MKMVVWTILLVLSPLLSGCFTIRETTRSSSSYAVLPDFVDRLEKASVTESNQLLIFIEGRLANSPHRDRHTITVPLSEVRIGKESYDGVTNSVGYIYLPRSVISRGWNAKQSTNVDCKPVFIGPPVAQAETRASQVSYCHLKENLHPDTTGNRAVFLVIDSPEMLARAKRKEYPLKSLELIYVHTTRPEAFTLVDIERDELGPRYWLLPLTITGDLVTLPLQIPVFIVATIINPG